MEFLVSFIPVFILFLAIVQLSFISAAKLVVRHAAVTGVRAAIVVLEDRKDLYNGEPYGEIGNSSSSSDESSGEEKNRAIKRFRVIRPRRLTGTASGPVRV